MTYNNGMETSFSEWLLRKFREWEQSTKHRQSVTAFARYLGVKQPSLNRWMTGDNIPDTIGILILAQKLGPEIFQVINVPLPAKLNRVFIHTAGNMTGEQVRAAIKEVDNILAAKPPVNIFEREVLQKKLLLERGIDTTIRYEIADDEINYLVENWSSFPISLKRQILSDIEKLKGEPIEPNTTNTPRLVPNPKT
jgi:transcriptional regulator with XRE-family HTH domain